MSDQSRKRPDRDVAAPSQQGQPTSLVARVRQLVEPLAARAEIELVDIEVRGSRGSRVVRVVGDAEGGLDVESIAALSRQVEAGLDERQLVEGGYTLEVSSPGLDQPLHTPSDFARRIGREVRVLRNQARPEGSPGELVGILQAVSEQAVTLEIEGDTHEVTLEEIEHGKVVLPW